MGVNGMQTYQQGPPPTQQPPTGNYNPFFAAQQPTQQPLSVNTAQFGGNLSSNPFTRSPTRMQSPTLSQIPEQAQQQFYAAPIQQQPQATNPFFTQMMSVPQQQPQQQQQFGQMQMHPQMGMSLAPQMTGYMQQYQQQQPPRPDKASILALYNYSQPAMNQNQNQIPNQFQSHDAGPTTTPAPTQTPNSLFPQQPQQQQQQPAPVNSGPGLGSGVGGSKNPFATAAHAGAGAGAGRLAEPAPKHNASRDSMMALGLEWSNGRHSPDAFASLSARDTR
jgi:hypothetical protein